MDLPGKGAEPVGERGGLFKVFVTESKLARIHDYHVDWETLVTSRS